MITPNDILITSELAYEGEGLAIGYKINDTPGVLLLSDEQLVKGLLRTDMIQNYNVEMRKVVSQHGFFRSLDDYMRLELSNSMAQKLVANHINNTANKPVKP